MTCERLTTQRIHHLGGQCSGVGYLGPTEGRQSSWTLMRRSSWTSLSFIELNALQKSICKIPEELDEVSIFSSQSLVDCIMASAPPFTPTPNCRLWKGSFAYKFASLAKLLAISLLKTSPTAIGRIPLFFQLGWERCTTKVWETNSGNSPRLLMFTSLVGTLKAICDWSEAVHCIACERCSWNIFERTSCCICRKQVQLIQNFFLTELIGLW